MPRRRGLRSRPGRHLVPGQIWPRGRLGALTPQEIRADTANDVLDVVNFVKGLAVRIEQKCKQESIYKVAQDANVNPQTVANFIQGDTWGDVVVIYRLERGLREALWTHGHVWANLRQKGRPRDYLTDDRQWPGGTLVRNAPAAVHFVRQLAAELRAYLWSGEPRQAVAENAGVDEKEILDFLRGDTWGDAEFIFRLERALNTRLWNHDHLPPPRPCDHLADGHDWPDGELKPEAPPHVHFTKQLAVKLQELCDTQTIATVADCAKCEEDDITKFLNGETWGDIEFIFRLEQGMKKAVWSHDHLQPR